MPFDRSFGFRGRSAPWPYVGLGRGGYPRCWAYGAYGPSWDIPYAYPYGAYSRGGYPYDEYPLEMDYTPYASMYPGAPYFSYPWQSPYESPMMTIEGEKEWLRSQVESIRQQINQITNRISELEEK